MSPALARAMRSPAPVVLLRRMVILAFALATPAGGVLAQGGAPGSPAARAISDPFFVFRPVGPRGSTPADRTRIEAKWNAVPGMTNQIASALADYEMNPGMATAIGVLKHYDAFSRDADLRAGFHAADPEVFLTLDAAKYELVMQTQVRMARQGRRIGHALRVGSSGARHLAWVAWAQAGKDLNSMPPADLSKQFQSDDDVTHHPPRAAASFEAAELLNGTEAAGVFLDVTRDYGLEMDPSEAKIEFLSPTRAWDIRGSAHADYAGVQAEDAPPLRPSFLHEWVASDPEKYNSYFAVEQLDRWAFEKGYITEDVTNPLGTRPYRDVYPRYSEGGRTRPRDYPERDLLGWMANQSRQLYATHAGELKYLRKYTERMRLAWEYFEERGGVPDKYRTRIQPPGDLETLAEDELTAYHLRLLTTAHQNHVDLLVDRMRELIVSNTRTDEDGVRVVDASFGTLMADAEFATAINALSIAYANTNADVRRELDQHLLLRIQSLSSDDHRDAYAGDLARYLMATRNDVVRTVGNSLRQTDAFRQLRERMGERLNQHLRSIGSASLDGLLLRVATGSFTRGELMLSWDGATFVERVLTPDDVRGEVEAIERFGGWFGWSDQALAARVREYFEGSPSTAVELVVRLHALTNPGSLRPLSVRWQDENGSTQSAVVPVTRLRQGLSLGLVSFKAALQGGQAIKKVYGQFNDGYQLYANLKAIYWDGGQTPEQMARAHAQVVASSLGLVEVGEYFGRKTLPVFGSLGGTLGAAASLSGGSFMDDGAANQLMLAMATDLIGAYVPALGQAMFLKDVLGAAYTSWTLSSAQNDIVDLLVENGNWTEDPAGLRNPTLTSWVRYDGGSAPEVVSDVREIARIQPDDWPTRGITLRTSRRVVHPRERLLDIAYLNNQVDADALNAPTISAVQSVLNDIGSWVPFSASRQPSRNWTASWLTGEWGVDPGVREDTRQIPAATRVALRTPAPGLFNSSSDSWPDHYQDAGKRVFGHLVREYWARRQVILEDVVLPKLIEAAAARKAQDLIATALSVDLSSELDKLDQRAARIDSTVWVEIAPSADPYFSPERELASQRAIRDHFRLVTAEDREVIRELEAWATDTTAATPAIVLQQSFDRPGAVAYARRLLRGMLDRLQGMETTYAALLADLDKTRKYVSASADGFDVRLYHAGVQGIPTGDPSVVSTWSAGYREAAAQVRSDIGSRLATHYEDAGLLAAQALGEEYGVLGRLADQFSSLIYHTVGWGDWDNVAMQHPFYPLLLRLRFQMQKLDNMQGGVSGMAAAELDDALGRMRSRGKAVSGFGASTPNERRTAIAEVRGTLREEYDELLDHLFDLVTADLTADPSDVPLLGEIEGSVGLQVNAEFDVLRGRTLDDLVVGLRWVLQDADDGSVVATQTTEKRDWSALPLRAGGHELNVFALGRDGVVVGSARALVMVTEAALVGTLEVTPGLPDRARAGLFLDRTFMRDLSSDGGFRMALEEVTQGLLLGLGLAPPQPGPPPERPRVRAELVPAVPRGASNPVTMSATPGLLRLDDLLRIDLDGQVTITVETLDAAGYPVTADRLFVESLKGSASSTADNPVPLRLPLVSGDPFRVRAERDVPSPGVRATTGEQLYQAGALTQPFVRVTLPFFDTGNLALRGRFVPATGATFRVAGGSVEAPGLLAAAVGSDGSFVLSNDSPMPLTATPGLVSTLRSRADWLIRPVTRPVPVTLRRGAEVDLGDLAVERYSVDLDLGVVVRDVTGFEFPTSDASVLVEGQAATPASGLFRASVTFEKRRQEIEIAASAPLSSGGEARGDTRLTLDDVPDWQRADQHALASPVVLTLPVYMAGNLTLRGSVVVEGAPPGATLPTTSDLAVGAAGVDVPVSVGTVFEIPTTVTVATNGQLDFTLHAQSADGVEYRGTSTHFAPAGPRVLDVGTLVLRPTRLAQADSSTSLPPSPPDSTGIVPPPDSTRTPPADSTRTGPTRADVIRDLAPLTSNWEARRDAARNACDWVAAADAQDRIVDLVDRWLGSVFAGPLPADIQALRARFADEQASLRRAARAEQEATDLISTARVEARAGQPQQALQTLEDAARLPDLPDCELAAIDAATQNIVDEVSRLMQEAVDAANQCSFERAVARGDQVAAIDPSLEWVQTDLLEFRQLARDQRRAQDLMDQAGAARAGGDMGRAEALAQQARGVAPDCDWGWIDGFLSSLQARPGAADPDPVAIDRSLVLLIDASGSMSGAKNEQARYAAEQTVRSLGPNVEVALITYGASGCGVDVVQGFTTDRVALRQAIRSVPASGSTPMAEGIGVATRYLEREARGTSAQILLLSDGQNNCSGDVGEAASGVRTGRIPIQLDGVGLGLESGGQAETDLRTAVNAAGTGRQYSATSSEELFRAFRRSSILGQVRTRDPYVDGGVSARLDDLYQAALAHLRSEDFEQATRTFEQAAREHPNAPSAHYNLSLAYEAEGRTLSAMESARRYLDLAPGARDRGHVEERIRVLEEQQQERPSAIFTPGRCQDLYAWARTESQRVREPSQRAQAFAIMTAAQRGDCGTAGDQLEAYRARYEG